MTKSNGHISFTHLQSSISGSNLPAITGRPDEFIMLYASLSWRIGSTDVFAQLILSRCLPRGETASSVKVNSTVSGGGEVRGRGQKREKRVDAFLQAEL